VTLNPYVATDKQTTLSSHLCWKLIPFKPVKKVHVKMAFAQKKDTSHWPVCQDKCSDKCATPVSHTPQERPSSINFTRHVLQYRNYPVG